MDVKVLIPTPRVSAITTAIDLLLADELPADTAEPEEIVILALWMLRCAGRCLQRNVDCETFVSFAHQAYHHAEEEDLTPEELLLKRFDTEDETPRH